MKKIQLFLILLLPFSLLAQSEAIVVEAESGVLGTDYSTLTDGSISYVSIQTNGAAQNPESEDRTILFNITFAHPGDYELYVKFRVGPNQYDDDSFFYGNGFGVKSPTENNDWQMMNSLVTFGYTNPNEIVLGEGSSTSEVWKWLNFSRFTGGEPGVIFSIDSANQTKSFQIGAREDGLDIDKLAFGKVGYFYTPTNLENGEAGSTDSTGGPGMLPIAYGQSKFLGNVYSGSQLSGFTNYWNQVTPENAGKWGSVEATRDVMNWTAMDAAYNLAKDNNFPFRFHVLIWGNQQPAWIENLPPNEQLEEIEEWFEAVATRYPDMEYVEVVNEPIHDPPNMSGNGGGNYIDALGGSGTTGWDWIINAFTLARQYFPNSQLMINDYNVISSASVTSTYKQIIELLQADSLIDVIGFQGHAFSTTASNSVMNANMSTLASTGLPLMVTEMEIDGPTDQIQLSEYQRIFPLFWNHPAIIGVTLWGFRPGMWRTDQMAYLIENDGFTERPALIWLRGFVSGTSSSVEEKIVEPTFYLYPNPVKKGESFVVESVNDEFIRQVQIFNNQGQLVYKETFPLSVSSSCTIRPNLSTGIYILQIKGTKNIHSIRISVN
jgi:endo-1,4-beta-xylanase